MALEPKTVKQLQPESDPRPVVLLPKPGLPGAVIAVVAAVSALVLFVVLEGRRLQRTDTQTHSAIESQGAFPSPPPLIVPPEGPLKPSIVTPAPVVAHIAPQPISPAPITQSSPIFSAPAPPTPQPMAAIAPSTPTRANANDPALVFDGGVMASGAPAGTSGSKPSPDSEREEASVSTTVIRNQTTVMPTGTVIPAVLETPIDSTRPGLVRALISSDARGFDGKRILIPRGSRLIGEYASDIRAGQKRVLVNWTRLIRPDGVAIRIGSPAADTLGGAGIPGRVNTYFFRRFASAVLQSALQVGVNLASRPGNGSVVVGLSNSTGGNIGQDLIPSADLKPRIKVKEGATLTVFVAHDLDFSGAPLVGKDRPS